ncbi:MAG: hypothetical protein M1540_04300 [Candidatus Bathyarchaeota archaeon]|nr:hypothetical protein [Candidatus Bathyarchaeota archaeon]
MAANGDGIADSEVLLNRSELDKMLQKARLEGAIGYITYLCEALDEGKIKTLMEIDQTIRGDWGSACSAVGFLMMETLQLDGFANGLMGNIKPEETQDDEKIIEAIPKRTSTD